MRTVFVITAQPPWPLQRQASILKASNKGMQQRFPQEAPQSWLFREQEGRSLVPVMGAASRGQSSDGRYGTAGWEGKTPTGGNGAHHSRVPSAGGERPLQPLRLWHLYWIQAWEWEWPQRGAACTGPISVSIPSTANNQPRCHKELHIVSVIYKRCENANIPVGLLRHLYLFTANRT